MLTNRTIFKNIFYYIKNIVFGKNEFYVFLLELCNRSWKFMLGMKIEQNDAIEHIVIKI